MDEDEDDVFVMDTPHWRSSIREIKQENRGTQTPGRPLARPNGMLPCGVSEEPTRLFYGSAGLLLLAPPARPEHTEHAMLQEDQRAMEPRRRPAHRVEVQIGQKLQMIGDQFYQEHMLSLMDKYSIPEYLQNFALQFAPKTNMFSMGLTKWTVL
ncbi:hypothetical protein NFI96_033098, partial [Prochilodus magdalenae]